MGAGGWSWQGRRAASGNLYVGDDLHANSTSATSLGPCAGRRQEGGGPRDGDCSKCGRGADPLRAGSGYVVELPPPPSRCSSSCLACATVRFVADRDKDMAMEWSGIRRLGGAWRGRSTHTAPAALPSPCFLPPKASPLRMQFLPKGEAFRGGISASEGGGEVMGWDSGMMGFVGGEGEMVAEF